MKIGVFDSGFGGLLVAESLIQALPDYEYLYLGDTKRVPYGNRSQATILEFSLEAIQYLFSQDCQLIIVACNTASAEALRIIQQTYLPHHFPKRRVLGVIVPTVEATIETGCQRVGILATPSTVKSGVYIEEMKKLNPEIFVIQQAAPLLVPLIENNGLEWSDPIICHYIQPFLENRVEVIVLGCTHYAAIKEKLRTLLPDLIIISQDELVANSLKRYLENHPEIETTLSRAKTRDYHVTDITENGPYLQKLFTGHDAFLTKVSL